MAGAFRESEAKLIRERLKKAGGEFLIRYGLRKTTVEQLAQAAGISTGAFYRFFKSKELLFFEIVEDMHEVLYGRALEILTSRGDLPQAERMEHAFMCFFSHLQELGLSSLWESEMGLLLRKIPEPVLRGHWTDDASHIRDLIAKAGLRLTVGEEEAASILHALTDLLVYRKNIGSSQFERTMRFLIRAVSRELDADGKLRGTAGSTVQGLYTKKDT